MYNLKHFVLCEKVIQNTVDKGVSLICVLNELTVVQLPASFPNFAFFASVAEAEGKPGKLAIRIICHHGKISEVIASFPERKMDHPNIQFFGQLPVGIQLVEPEDLRFVLEVKLPESEWAVVGEQRIRVIFAPAKVEA